MIIYRVSQPLTHQPGKYSDPWDPARLATAKKAADMNMWYSFLHDVFLDGRGVTLGLRGYHTIFHEPFKYVASTGNMTYQFVFMLPLWRTSAQRNHHQCLIEAIQMKQYLLLKPHRFLYIIWAPRCENPICLVTKLELIDPYKEKKELFTHHNPLNSLRFLMVTKFLLLHLSQMFGR
jgi:hypothetical protein